MADVRPFRALRYDNGKIGDVGSVLAPPYDVISASQREALYAASPHNIAYLELPPRAADPYAAAARSLDEWRRGGILRREDRPCFYRYQQSFQVNGRSYARTAVFARVRLVSWDEGKVLPHEHTLAEPKEDRLRLLRATRTNVSPVFALYVDEGDAVSRVLASASSELLLEARDMLGHEHQLARISGAEDCSSLADLLSRGRLYIADGHHRWETALAYRDEVRAGRGEWTGEEPENFALVALTAIRDPGLLVLPIHRIVHREPLDDLRPMLDEDFDVHAVGPQDAVTLTQLLERMAAGGAHTFGMVGPPGAPLRILEPRGDAPLRRTPSGHPDAWRNLDVVVLQSAILERCFGISLDDVAGGGAVTFTEDADEAMGEVLSGEASYAFLVNPTRVEQILAVADAGARMPQKSTFFFPKLGTGLVLNPLED